MGDGNQAFRRLGQLDVVGAGEKAERGGNRRQRRAQLVADRRDELILQALDTAAFADVDDHAENMHPLAGTDWIEADFDQKFAAVLALSEKIASSRHPGLRVAREPAPMPN